MDEKQSIKPLIKWVGGKTQIIDKIIDKFPKVINNYHELFVGGGSVLIALLENIAIKNIVVKGTINVYDVNTTLIYFYKNIQKSYKAVFETISVIIEEFNSFNDLPYDKKIKPNRKPLCIEDITCKETYYYWIRQLFNSLKNKKSVLATAYFIFLNKTCFRGVYREGPKGFNVPYGHYNNPEIINKKHLRKFKKLISSVNFFNSDFMKSFENCEENDFLYLDPPYAPINNKSFVKYNSSGFDLEQHVKLFDKCKSYNFLMSNSCVPLVLSAFDDVEKYEILEIDCKRKINSKKPESTVKEVLIYTIDIK